MVKNSWYVRELDAALTANDKKVMFLCLAKKSMIFRIVENYIKQYFNIFLFNRPFNYHAFDYS